MGVLPFLVHACIILRAVRPDQVWFGLVWFGLVRHGMALYGVHYPWGGKVRRGQAGRHRGPLWAAPPWLEPLALVGSQTVFTHAHTYKQKYKPIVILKYTVQKHKSTNTQKYKYIKVVPPWLSGWHPERFPVAAA